MAKPTVDGPGQAKLQSLETATSLAQTVHGLVEKYAIAVRTGQATAAYPQQIKRAATPLVGLLRSQFQLLADMASDLILVATRGGGADQVKVRMLRERVGVLKSGIELAVTSTLAKHKVDDGAHGEAGAPGSSTGGVE
ncbi:MAG: hypothetical protein IT355_19275 [Gemmatimonadaceae bacterium]|nr:hypothetical protein [Gemmatimonadaceae bacterium]